MRITDYRLDASRQWSPKLKSRSWALSLFCVVALVAVPYTMGVSQTMQTPSGNAVHDYSGIPPMNLTSNPVPDANRFLESSMRMKDNQKRIAALNLQRQKDMATEAAEVVKLAIELRAETDQASREKLSVVALHKAELIEKLAKNVRNKMKAWDED
jgi:hypothetical protein